MARPEDGIASGEGSGSRKDTGGCLIVLGGRSSISDVVPQKLSNMSRSHECVLHARLRRKSARATYGRRRR
jgi:hypothetical protein